ncbi:MAG: MT-A70 family methyltransferase [Alphaproteobacteria bacterium]
MSSDPFPGLPRRHFAAVLADPPWHFRARSIDNRSQWRSRRDAEKFYNVLGIDDIVALPVQTLAAPDAHLFLWATGPCLPHAFRVIEAWGFRYSGIAFTWIKTKRKILAGTPVNESGLHVGLGFTTRKNAEFCLLARRGNARRIAKDVREVILSPVREHSRKPDEARARIERYCAGPYLELFARDRRPGWEAWGDQVDHFSVDLPYDEQVDALESYNDGVREVGRRVKAGAPLPDMFIPSREWEAT